MAGIYVPGRGPLSARLCIVGEAPGRQEEEQRRPFVGASGKLQEGYLRQVGIDPAQVRYENVYPFRPKGKGGSIQSVPQEELTRWQEDCLARLDRLPAVWVIVPVGNTALSCLCGTEQISLRRGSMYQWKNVYGRDVKVIPTIHPAAILRDTTLEYRTTKDWERIACELRKGPEVIYPLRKFLLDPDRERFCAWADAVLMEGEKPLAIDIETSPQDKKILCVGFAGSSDVGVSLTWNQEHKGWIRWVCQSSQPKILQNGLYDLYWLRMFGVEVTNYQYDTMAMSHCLRPNNAHSLAFMTSIYTDEPYYKGGDDEDDEKAWEWSDWYSLLEYNARDCMVTYEIGWEKLWPMIQSQGCEARYRQHYQALFEPLLGLMTHGVRVNHTIMEQEYGRLSQAARTAQSHAEQLCGERLSRVTGKGRQAFLRRLAGESGVELEKAIARLRTPLAEVERELSALGISDQCLAQLLYKTWKLPVQTHRKTGSVTVDEHALRTLLHKVEKRGDQTQALFLQEVLRFRHQVKLKEFYRPERLDEDGRMRCEYSYNTRPGRLKSKKNPMGGGANLQNQSRKAREMFVPDTGCLMAEIDLSQIQARFVYVMAFQASGDPKLLELAQSKPWEKNIHKLGCVEMFHVAYEEVTPEQYYKGKITEHATNFGLGADHLQEVFLKGEEGVRVSLKECQELIARKFAAKPGILDWQQAIREEALMTRKLVSAWGVELDVTYERPGVDLWRKCYAWKPQADEARHLNLLGLVPTWQYMRDRGYTSKITLQVHDALVFSLRLEEAYDIIRFCVTSLEQPRDYYGVELSIPCTVKIGMSWKGEQEWKQMPSQETFLPVATSIMEGSLCPVTP